MFDRHSLRAIALLVGTVSATTAVADDGSTSTDLFERRIRPMLIEHCYECHSEQSSERQGGLLLDRSSAWLEGGASGKAVLPGDTESSLLIAAIRYADDELQMPPDGPLDDQQVAWFEQWVRSGAHAPDDPVEPSEFTRLGDQTYLFEQAEDHWAFQPVSPAKPPAASDPNWNRHEIDRFVFDCLAQERLTPSPPADPGVLIRRLYHSLIGLPPTMADVKRFTIAVEIDRELTVRREIDRLLASPHFGQHLGRMWLDVARYADTDGDYRPDTKTPHYFPFAFTYRDYIVDAFNGDKPLDRFLTEQVAADLLGLAADAPELAALGFFAVGPHANRAQAETLDDWIDITTRGLMGITAACARCHDHKFEPVPTEDYYALRGIFAATSRPHPLDETQLPRLSRYRTDASQVAAYEQQRAKIDAKIEAAQGKTAGNNNRSIAEKILETELAELLLFHPGAPARAMVVADKPEPPPSFVFIRGDAAARGRQVPRRFLSILDRSEEPFSTDGSGRLELAARITDPNNPLTARVFVNRVWGHLMGTYLVATPSDFGLAGERPTHPELLDWLADDFVRHGWSIKHLVRTIVASEVYAQSSAHRPTMAEVDPENRCYWRANRQHLTIEAIRDGMLTVAGELDRQIGGRAQPIWDEGYTVRRAIYGYINRFNLDPTLRAFDFPAPMQTQPQRGESIVAPQALFLMNSPFVIDRADAITGSTSFDSLPTDRQRIENLFAAVLQREPALAEVNRVEKFVRWHRESAPSSDSGDSPWRLVAQSLLISNEFQYVD